MRSRTGGGTRSLNSSSEDLNFESNLRTNLNLEPNCGHNSNSDSLGYKTFKSKALHCESSNPKPCNLKRSTLGSCGVTRPKLGLSYPNYRAKLGPYFWAFSVVVVLAILSAEVKTEQIKKGKNDFKNLIFHHNINF